MVVCVQQLQSKKLFIQTDLLDILDYPPQTLFFEAWIGLVPFPSQAVEL
jgi:hypothetical protein